LRQLPGRPVILFRCDGTAEVGFGHLSRSIALAEAMAECGVACRFVGRFDAGAVEMIEWAGLPHAPSAAAIGDSGDLPDTIEAARAVGAAAVVIDSYRVNADHLTAVNRSVAPVVVIDDFGALSRYDCAAVLNFTVGAGSIAYPEGTYARLLGPRYFTARRALRRQRAAAVARTGDVRHVLVAIGGVDRHDLSGLVTSALLQRCPDMSVQVVVGRGYDGPEALGEQLARFHTPGRLLTQLPTLAEPLAWADLCVCGGGLTKYESAYLGVPAAVLSQSTAQALETVDFAARGLAVDLGTWERVDAGTAWRGLSALVRDTATRAALSRKGLATFPADPTRVAAEACLAACAAGGR